MSNNNNDDDDDNDNDDNDDNSDDDNDDDNNNDDNDITFLYFRLRSPPLATDDGVLFCDFLDAAGLPKIGPLSSSLSLPSAVHVVGFLLNVLRSNVST